MRHIRVDVSVEHTKGSCGALPRRPPVDQAAAPRIAEREADILGHRHPVDQAEVLMDERNRQAAQRAGRVAPAELDAAGIQRVDAGEDLDQRGLACAVLAQQRQDLAGAELEVNVIERQRAPEALGYASELQHRCALRADRSIRRQSGRRGAQVGLPPGRSRRAPAVLPAVAVAPAILLMGLGRRLSMLFGRRLSGDRHTGHPARDECRSRVAHAQSARAWAIRTAVSLARLWGNSAVILRRIVARLALSRCPGARR